MRRVAIAMVLVAFSLIGCGRQGGTDQVAKGTAWHQVLQRISPSGEVDKQTALQAFSIAFGPLPGVSVPTGDVPAVVYASGPVRWLTPYWDELTPAQQGAVAKAVGPLGPMKSGVTSTTELSLGTLRLIAAEAVPERYEDAVAVALVALRGRLPWTIPVEPTVKLDSTPGKHVALAVSSWPTDTATHIDGCSVTFYPAAQAASQAGLNAAAVHEVFHCFQAEIMGQGRFMAARPWVVEGSAMYVGEDLGGPSDLQVARDHWKEYLSAPGPEGSLFGRAYDAIGFYAHLQKSGVDVYAHLRGVLTAGGNEASFAAAGVSDRFMTTWGSGLFRESPSAWDTSGPGILPKSEASPPVHPLRVRSGEGLKVDVRGLANKLFRLASDADVVKVAVSGWGRLADDEGLDRPIAREFVEDFCMRKGGCKCPPGSEAPNPEATPAKGDLRLALTGDPASAGIGATALIFGDSMDSYCRKKDGNDRPVGGVAPGGGGGDVPRGGPGGTGTVCEEATKRTTVDGQLSNPSMGPAEIRRCLDEILKNSGFGPR